MRSVALVAVLGVACTRRHIATMHWPHALTSSAPDPTVEQAAINVLRWTDQLPPLHRLSLSSCGVQEPDPSHVTQEWLTTLQNTEIVPWDRYGGACRMGSPLDCCFYAHSSSLTWGKSPRRRASIALAHAPIICGPDAENRSAADVSGCLDLVIASGFFPNHPLALRTRHEKVLALSFMLRTWFQSAPPRQ